LEKKLFRIPDFFIAFGSPIDANIMDIFGFRRVLSAQIIKIVVL
jgi:hypothetical protein